MHERIVIKILIANVKVMLKTEKHLAVTNKCTNFALRNQK